MTSLRDPAADPLCVVIGGGLAGLAAADRLTQCSARVVLIEPRDRCGGMLDTVRDEGWLLERSADSFLTAKPEALELVQRLGLENELISVAPDARRALILATRPGRPERLLPVPAGFRLLAPGRPLSLLQTPLLSPYGRLRAFAERWIPARDRSVPSRHTADESLESFAVRRLGREAFDRIVQPLVAGIWTADPARLSMAASCPEFLAMEASHGSLTAGEQDRLKGIHGAEMASGARYGQFVTLASGLGRLPDRLLETLLARGVLKLRARVSGISRRPDGRLRIELAAATPSGPGHDPIEADAAVLAIAAPIAAGLLEPIDAQLAAELRGIEYAGSAIVSLGWRQEDMPHPLNAAGIVIPRSSGRRLLALSFTSAKFAGRAPTGCTLMRAFVGGALDPDAIDLEDDALATLAVTEVRRILGGQAHPIRVQIDRWQRAMPQYHVGHLERLERIEERLLTQPGIALAGAAYRGVGIPQVVASGSKAAERCLTILGARRETISS
jgi:oxygen-dependent protoporphyrinogen oxidase